MTKNNEGLRQKKSRVEHDISKLTHQSAKRGSWICVFYTMKRKKECFEKKLQVRNSVSMKEMEHGCDKSINWASQWMLPFPDIVVLRLGEKEEF